MQQGDAREAEVMISHSWKEDMEQVQTLLNNYKGTMLHSGKKFSNDSVIWFFCLANFQVNGWGTETADPIGPMVAAQLKLDPFNAVISSVKDMFVLHTSCGPV